MFRLEPWKAFGLLVTFVAGGFIAPVVHRADHAVEWAEQRAAAHPHEDSDGAALRTACADVAADLQDCRLCHRNWLGDFVATVGPWLFDLSEENTVHFVRPTPVLFEGSTPIRAPPTRA